MFRPLRSAQWRYNVGLYFNRALIGSLGRESWRDFIASLSVWVSRVAMRPANCLDNEY